jgi:hypothetical protein
MSAAASRVLLVLNSILLVSMVASSGQDGQPPLTDDIDTNAAPMTEATSGLVFEPPPPPVSCVAAPAGLVSWWRGERNTEDDWDSNQGTGTVSGSPIDPPVVTFTTGKVGSAFSSSFTVEDSESLRLTNALTIEAWVYLNTAFDLTNRVIVSKYGLPSSISYVFGCTNRSLYLQVSPTGLPQESTGVRGPQQLPLTNWVHVAATYDGSALRLYTNGTLIASTAYSLPIFRGLANVGIGRVPVDPFATATTISNGFWNWRGLLDEVSIYNRALTDAELQSIANAGSAGKCLSPPVIVVQPDSQIVPLAEDVMFSAKVVGLKPITYRWTSNNVAVPVINGSSANLLIEKVKTANAGTYSVLVSNRLGTATSSVATLTVVQSNSCFEPPLGITDWWPGDMSGANLIEFFPTVVTVSQSGLGYPFVIGKVARAFGEVSREIFPPTYTISNTWTIASAPTLNFSPTNSFSIEHWIKTDSRSRTVLNGWPYRIGPASGDTAVIMQKGMTNSTGGYSLFLDRGRFCCAIKAAGQPGTNIFRSAGPDLRDDMFHHVAVTVTRNATNGGNLYVDGQAVLTFDTTIINGAISNNVPVTFFVPAPPYPPLISLDAVAALDEPAFYNRALSASEVNGIYSAGAAGKRKTRPVIAVPPASQTAALGSDAHFTVTPDGNGFLRYRWLHNGIFLSGATNQTLMLSNITLAAGGTYSVQLSNVFGTTISSNALLNILPVALCSNIMVAADSTMCTAQASVDAGSYDPDAPDRGVTLLQVPPGPYAIGTTPVMLVVTDRLGASNACMATVTVLDRTPPQIVCPAVAAKPNDPRQCGAVVQYPLPQASDSCSAVTNVVCDPPSGSFFPVGTTMVNCTATDGGGNSAQCSFPVTVLDAEPPLLSCPSAIVVTNAHEAWNSVVTFQAPASDNCAGVGAVVATPVSGSIFPVGTNAVSCVVTDAAGNIATCSFNVVVVPGNHPPTPVIEISPLVHFPGWTNLMVIAPRGASARVALDGSQSSDPDGDPFGYEWLEGTNVLSTNEIASVTLDVGSHEITLALDDHLPLGTNSERVSLEIITPGQAVVILSGRVHDSDLSSKARQPLLASLNATYSSFQRGSFSAGANQLGAFQNKVAAQLGQLDATLAEQLIDAAQQIIDAVR